MESPLEVDQGNLLIWRCFDLFDDFRCCDLFDEFRCCDLFDDFRCCDLFDDLLQRVVAI